MFDYFSGKSKNGTSNQLNIAVPVYIMESCPQSQAKETDSLINGHPLRVGCFSRRKSQSALASND